MANDARDISQALWNHSLPGMALKAASQAGAWIEDKASDAYAAAKPYLPSELGGTLGQDRPSTTATTMRTGQKPAKAKMRHGS